MSDLERRIDFYPAFDKRDPRPDKDCGIHCVTMRMVVIGPKGAVHFTVYTGWHLPEIQKELEEKVTREHNVAGAKILTKPIPVDIGYHSPVPTDSVSRAAECDLLPGGECYGSGNMLRARAVFEVLTRDGSDGVWKILEGEYRVLFGEGGTDEMDIEEVPEEKVQDKG